MEILGYYQRTNGSFHTIEHVGFDDNGDYLCRQLFATGKPYVHRRCDIEKEFVRLENFDLESIPRQTCGRRMNDFGPWERSENIDHWRHDGTCSFCGSISWEKFQEVVDKVIEGVEGYTIEKADGKSYKWYVHAPEWGKFYTHHVPRALFAEEKKAELDEANRKLTAAAQKSWDRFTNRFKPDAGS
jgi:hypothetical protein